MQKQISEIPENEPVISLTHIYDAPRALVWDTFTKPEHLVHWWGPNGFTIEHKSAEFRLGGHWAFTMIGPDGTRWESYHRFTEFDPMDVITHRHGTEIENPDSFESRTTFIDKGEKTEVNMRMTFPSFEARAEVMAFGAHELGLETLANAETYLNRTGASA